jgi:hypothetical protein
MPDPQRTEPDPIWSAFQERYGGNTFLSQDPVYSMTEEVITAIGKEIPDFFTADQQQFEEDLARSTGGGFFLRRPIGVPTTPLARPDLTIEEFLLLGAPGRDDHRQVVKPLTPALNPAWFKDKHVTKAIHAIGEMIVTLRQASGWAEKDIRSVQKLERAEEQVRVRRGEAYMAWLILNRPFRDELQALRNTWEATVARRGNFPWIPTQEEIPTPNKRPKRLSACSQALVDFCRHWGLARLLTWELPAPRGACFLGGESKEWPVSSAEGITFSVPWYLLRGGQFDLQAIAQRIRLESTPAHLREWVCKPADRDDATGETTYQHLYGLYRCYELVLFRRYRNNCARNFEKLDRALSGVMCRETDLVKRLRQRLMRELPSVEKPK